MKRRAFSRGIVLATGSFAMPAVLRANTVGRPLDLVLCLDTSPSMYTNVPEGYLGDYTVQRDGHAAALRDPKIQHLLISNQTTVHIILWSGRGMSRRLLSKSVEDRADADQLARDLLWAVPTQPDKGVGTQPHRVMEFACAQFLQRERKLILDISANEGPKNLPGCIAARKTLSHNGGTCNVLGVGLSSEAQDRFIDYVVTDTGFLETTNSYDAYPEAIRRKLLRELIT